LQIGRGSKNVSEHEIIQNFVDALPVNVGTYQNPRWIKTFEGESDFLKKYLNSSMAYSTNKSIIHSFLYALITADVETAKEMWRKHQMIKNYIDGRQVDLGTYQNPNLQSINVEKSNYYKRCLGIKPISDIISNEKSDANLIKENILLTKFEKLITQNHKTALLQCENDITLQSAIKQISSDNSNQARFNRAESLLKTVILSKSVGLMKAYLNLIDNIQLINAVKKTIENTKPTKFRTIRLKQLENRSTQLTLFSSIIESKEKSPVSVNSFNEQTATSETPATDQPRTAKRQKNNWSPTTLFQHDYFPSANQPISQIDNLQPELTLSPPFTPSPQFLESDGKDEDDGYGLIFSP